MPGAYIKQYTRDRTVRRPALPSRYYFVIKNASGFVPKYRPPVRGNGARDSERRAPLTSLKRPVRFFRFSGFARVPDNEYSRLGPTVWTRTQKNKKQRKNEKGGVFLYSRLSPSLRLPTPSTKPIRFAFRVKKTLLLLSKFELLGRENDISVIFTIVVPRIRSILIKYFAISGMRAIIT